MSLTLFPITALLFLLSGVGSPMQAPAQVESRAALLRELFGNYDAANGDAVWSPTAIPPRYAEYFSDGRGFTTPIYDTRFTDHGAARRLLVLGTVPERGWGCHSCNQLVSAVLLNSTQGDKWTVEDRSDFLGTGGEWGYPPKARLRHFGTGHIALELDTNHCGPGDCYDLARFYAVTSPRFHLLLGLLNDYKPSDLEACVGLKRYTEQSDCGQAHLGGMCFPHVSPHNEEAREFCTDWTSSLRLVPPARPGNWSDLLYIQHVRLAVPGAFTHKQYRTRFGFGNGAYQAVGPPAHGPRSDLRFYQE